MAIKNIKIIIILLILSGCSSNKDYDSVKKTVDIFLGSEKENKIKSFTREEIYSFNYPIIEIRTEGIVKQVLMLPISTRKSYTNWITGTGQAITMEGSAVTKTNGFDTGLLSVKLEEKSPLIFHVKPNDWPESEKITYGFLTEMNSQYNVEVICEHHILENEDILILDKYLNLIHINSKCSGKEIFFENDYWLDEEGFIWYSNQLISNKKIMANIKFLKRTY